MVENNSRRSGGRSARKALRAAPLSKEMRPIKPGMESKTYQPLNKQGMIKIHNAALDALEQIGFGEVPETGKEILTNAGAIMGDDGRIRFPRALVEDMIAKAAKEITLFGRNPDNDMQIGGERVYYGTAGAAVHLVDVEKNEYRECYVQDLFDAAKIVNALDNVHFLQRPMVCRDIPDNYEMDLNTIYACTRGTTKHVGASFTEPGFVKGAFDLLHEIAGGEKQWRERPFVSNSNCFVVPPMKFAMESCQVMEECVRGGMPILLLSAGQAGATAPAPIAGAIVQAVAECLAGLVYVNAMVPGHPAIFGTWPFVSDLRTGAMSGGSGEQALLTAGCSQKG